VKRLARNPQDLRQAFFIINMKRAGMKSAAISFLVSAIDKLHGPHQHRTSSPAARFGGHTPFVGSTTVYAADDRHFFNSKAN